MISMISMILSVCSWFPFLGAYLRSFAGHLSFGKVIAYCCHLFDSLDCIKIRPTSVMSMVQYGKAKLKWDTSDVQPCLPETSNDQKCQTQGSHILDWASQHVISHEPCRKLIHGNKMPNEPKG